MYLQHSGGQTDTDQLQIEWDDDSYPTVLSQYLTLSWEGPPDSASYQEFLWPQLPAGSHTLKTVLICLLVSWLVHFYTHSTVGLRILVTMISTIVL